MAPEGPSKKLRKPYTITKCRDRWAEEEHERFLDALLLFGRDWKKVQQFVGTKTVIQIRSHAQKYFLKVQKNGIMAHVPPPRPKRKASYPYIQKSLIHDTVPLQESLDHSSSSHCLSPVGNVWEITSVLANYPANEEVPPVDYFTALPQLEGNTSSSWATYEEPKQENLPPLYPAIPNMAEAYRFIGGFIDPEIKWPLGVHLHKLKQMDPITIKSVLLLVRNLINNLCSPDFELLRRTLSTHDTNTKKTADADESSATLMNQIQTSMRSPYVDLLPPY